MTRALRAVRPNGLELSCPAKAGKLPLIVACAGGLAAPPYDLARRPKVPGVLPGGSAEGRSSRMT
jgi:hypothetical protein